VGTDHLGDLRMDKKIHNIKTDLGEIGSKDMKWTDLFQNTIQWRGGGFFKHSPVFILTAKFCKKVVIR
jgi:hypothetical protein